MSKRMHPQAAASSPGAVSSVGSTPRQPLLKRPLVAPSPEVLLQPHDLENVDPGPRRAAGAAGARRCLSFFDSHQKSLQLTPWKEEEVKELLKFVYFKGYQDSWPAFKTRHCFWSELADHLNMELSTFRTAAGCRSKLQKYLQQEFTTPSDAVNHYFPQGLVMESSPLAAAQPENQLNFISRSFQNYAMTKYRIIVPSDFLELSLSAMSRLQAAGRTNMIYSMSKAIGTLRPDSEESRLPISRMPMGLLEYCVNFYSSTHLQQVHCPEDYRQWLISMYSLFGTKWVKLFCGPMWKVEATSQDEATGASSSCSDPLQARVNVPGLSERQLERNIASCEMSMGSEIQVKILEAAHSNSPQSNWWLKGDGCDLVAGLGESMRLQWSGDSDLNDGSLQKMYDAYRSLLDSITSLTLDSVDSLKKCYAIIMEEKEFLVKALQAAEKEYREKAKEAKSGTKALFAAGWTVEELQKLLEERQQIAVNLDVIIEHLESGHQQAASNPAMLLASIQKQLKSFIQAIYRHKRTVATNVYVMMISSERRQTKPYALPIQLLPYSSIDENTMRGLIRNIVKTMKARGMNVVGFCSNGEFNSMRNKGYTRPISVFQIRSEVRAKYSRLSERTMLAMLTAKFESSGSITAEKPSEAVSPILLCEVFLWRAIQKLSWDDVISRLRPRTVPAGYPYHPWKKDQCVEDEDRVDKLRSILAQLEFSHRICAYDQKGVPFKSHLHCPEVHPDTLHTWYEREDPAHVLKRIAKCTREGGPSKVKLERFVEALQDETTGLTYPALVGTRKQSVQDAERMFTQSLADFMERKGYSEEAKYIRAVNGWRRAVDERGLSNLQRCRFNYIFLNYILDDLMPWHAIKYDFSTLEVNKDISNVCGFTRQVLVAVVALIETTEWRRRELVVEKLPPENPRASTTDDIECFFSVIRDLVGKNFTLKQVKFEWRKICNEFLKRINPNLPYYYYTSSHDRFYEGERPHFDTESRRKKSQRIPAVEASTVFRSGRATMPLNRSLTVRAQFHNPPTSCPPPPNVPVHLSEHSY